MRTFGLSAWAVGLLVASSGIAVAGDVTWRVQEVRPGEVTPQVKDPPPEIEVEVIGEPAPEDASGWTLQQVDGAAPRPVTPVKVIPYKQGRETLALVLLVEGHEYYLGNDHYVDEPPPFDPAHPPAVLPHKRSAGVHQELLNALDVLAGAGPAGSRGGLVVYSVGAELRGAMGPLDKLNGDVLGPQELQKGKISRDLGQGLDLAFDQLHRTQAARKLLVVVSDGFDVGGAAAMRGIKRKLDGDKVEVYAFHLALDSTYIPDDDATKRASKQNLQALAGEHYVPVRAAGDLAGKITSVIGDAVNDRFWLVFPGAVRAAGRPAAGFTWDGKEHELSLSHDGDAVSEKPIPTVLGLVWGQPVKKSRWWLWLAIGGGGVMLLGLVINVASRKPAPVAAPPPVVVEAPVVKPPPSPLVKTVYGSGDKPNRTIAVNIDGIPVVGWLVPINGPQKGTTFKLASGVTKIGNARGVHVFIDDGYMSGDHAHIAMTPLGFTLIDNLSTNGTYVNEQRVDRHELIDNDVVKFGKTELKFKTIQT